MKANRVMAIGVAALMSIGLSGCGKPMEEQAKKPDTGRKETRVIEAADTIGYGNAGVRKKVDKALDTNDNRVEDLNKSIDEQSQ